MTMRASENMPEDDVRQLKMGLTDAKDQFHTKLEALPTTGDGVSPAVASRTTHLLVSLLDMLELELTAADELLPVLEDNFGTPSPQNPRPGAEAERSLKLYRELSCQIIWVPLPSR